MLTLIAIIAVLIALLLGFAVVQQVRHRLARRRRDRQRGGLKPYYKE